jgi:hypothetical protein
MLMLHLYLEREAFVGAEWHQHCAQVRGSLLGRRAGRGVEQITTPMTAMAMAIQT